jgi:hypothetical protein
MEVPEDIREKARAICDELAAMLQCGALPLLLVWLPPPSATSPEGERRGRDDNMDPSRNGCVRPTYQKTFVTPPNGSHNRQG